MIVFAVLFSEFFHYAIDFLALTWESEATEHSFEGLNVRDSVEIEGVDILIEDLFVQVDILTKIFSNLGLIETCSRFQEIDYPIDVFLSRLLRDKTFLHQVGDAILGFQVELDTRLEHLILLQPRLLELIDGIMLLLLMVILSVNTLGFIIIRAMVVNALVTTLA